MKFKFILSTIAALTCTLSLSAQNDALSVGLRINMQTAIESFESKDSAFFDPQLAAELTEDYRMRYIELSDPKTGVEEEARDLLSFYSTPEGMEEMLIAWNSQIDSFIIQSIADVLFKYTHLPFETNVAQQPGDNLQLQNAPNISTDKSTSSIDKSSAKRIKQKGLPANRDISREKIKPKKIPDTPDKRIGINEPSKNRALPIEKRLSALYSPNEIESLRLAAIYRLQMIAPYDTSANRKMMAYSMETPNKYARLLVNEPEITDAEMYLDGKMIAPVKKIKKGILVHSKQRYLFEIKSVGENLCGDTITLAPQEEKTITCTKK